VYALVTEGVNAIPLVRPFDHVYVKAPEAVNEADLPKHNVFALAATVSEGSEGLTVNVITALVIHPAELVPIAV
jgi:hypothetical protein